MSLQAFIRCISMNRTKGFFVRRLRLDFYLDDLHWLCTRCVPRITALAEVFGSDFLILISGCNNQGYSQTTDWQFQLFFRVILVTKIWCQTLAYGNNLMCFRGRAKWLLSCSKWTAEDFPWHWECPGLILNVVYQLLPFYLNTEIIARVDWLYCWTQNETSISG